MRKLLLIVAVVGCAGEIPQPEASGMCGESCEVVLRAVAALDFSDAPFMPSMFVNVEQLSDGTFAVVDFARGSAEILHFSVSGSYIDSHMQVGDGPGEAREIRHLLAIDDSLLVIDAGLARCTLLDSAFAYVRDFECFGAPSDAAMVDGRLFLTGFGPMGLVEVDPADGEREPARSEGERVPVSDDYASIAADTAGVWFVAHPSEYRLTYWRSGESRPSRVIQRDPEWWQPGEPFLFTRVPAGVRMPDPQFARERQVMSGPLLFNIAVSDGFVWTAGYVQTLQNRQYSDFLSDWLNQGLQGDVAVFLQALTPKGELVASAAFDDLAPPRFTVGGLMYTVVKEGHGTGVMIYRPKVEPTQETPNQGAERSRRSEASPSCCSWSQWDSGPPSPTPSVRNAPRVAISSRRAISTRTPTTVRRMSTAGPSVRSTAPTSATPVSTSKITRTARGSALSTTNQPGSSYYRTAVVM